MEAMEAMVETAVAAKAAVVRMAVVGPSVAMVDGASAAARRMRAKKMAMGSGVGAAREEG